MSNDKVHMTIWIDREVRGELLSIQAEVAKTGKKHSLGDMIKGLLELRAIAVKALHAVSANAPADDQVPPQKNKTETA